MWFYLREEGDTKLDPGMWYSVINKYVTYVVWRVRGTVVAGQTSDIRQQAIKRLIYANYARNFPLTKMLLYIVTLTNESSCK
jgi:hypothetical protein